MHALPIKKSFYLLLRNIFLSLGAFTAFMCASAFADTAPETDLAILQMFYRESELIVVSPTRSPKRISQVAENIHVVTAEDIELMNAHTVADVLDMVPGLFVSFSRDFGASALLGIQGSENRHVQVLLDGMRFNLLTSGHAETAPIPVGIIERIEIIKGPASSAWGSSLGGVINIITKDPGTTARPAGSVRVSHGERGVWDCRAQASGKTGPLGYYLYAGWQDSGRLSGGSYFDADSIYGKFSVAATSNIDLTLSTGYTRPHIGAGDSLALNLTNRASNRIFFADLSLEASLTPAVSLHAALHTFRQKAEQLNESLGPGVTGSAGERYQQTQYDEKTSGGMVKLVWRAGRHAVVAGFDFDHGKLRQRSYPGMLLQLFGAPSRFATRPDVDRWAVYVNDTMTAGRWTITPGVRYDHDSNYGPFLSPSLGITCSLGSNLLIRASVSRGFTNPGLSLTSGGSLFLVPNSSLDPERIWSYQAGMETALTRYLLIKATLFRHDMKRTLRGQQVTGGSRIVNGGSSRRRGIECEVQTQPVYNLSLTAGYTFVNISPSKPSGSSNIYSYKIALVYNDNQSLKISLTGSYNWWDFDASADAQYDDFIWDVNIVKVVTVARTTAEFFLTLRNLFNSSQFSNSDNKNPGRWAEAGIRVRF